MPLKGGGSIKGGGPAGQGSGNVIVRYFAGARAAVGEAEEALSVESADAYTLEDLIGELVARHGPQLAKVLAVASFLVDGTVCRDRGTVLPTGATVDILPPFSGG